MNSANLPIIPEKLNPIPVRLNAEAGRPSAVLVGLIAGDDGWQVIMTERAHHLAHHAGQISFPGGKVEGSDASLIDTALREAGEEVALPRDQVEIIGGLNTVVSPAGFIVQPIVGLVAPNIDLIAAPDEVAEIIILPLAPLLDPTRHGRETFLRNGTPRDVSLINHDQHHIWGLSASILIDLAGRGEGGILPSKGI
jgi:8-oxo-dGTP pyrophosphatase MutT (NUDIX family)